MMVDARVETEISSDKAAFVGATGDADNLRAGKLGELPDHCTDRARSRRHDHGFAALRPTDLAEPDVSGKPRHAEDAECGRQRRGGRIELDQTLGRHRAIELPAITAENKIAFAIVWITRPHDLPDNATFDDRANLDRLGI
jgi:hypothetical protein